jgi:translation initiation factor IF-1
MGDQVSRDRLEMQGVVIEGSKGVFKVKMDNGMIVQATLSGKIRQNSVKILLGDAVKVEVSPYDVSRGRIVFRLKQS